MIFIHTFIFGVELMHVRSHFTCMGPTPNVSVCTNNTSSSYMYGFHTKYKCMYKIYIKYV
jgi:hypothetical protein